jgi:hypothetical protein
MPAQICAADAGIRCRITSLALRPTASSIQVECTNAKILVAEKDQQTTVAVEWLDCEIDFLLMQAIRTGPVLTVDLERETLENES